MANVISLTPNIDSGDIISGLLLPVMDLDLLLPNVSVAEVIDYQTPESDAGKPEWFLGAVSWRGRSLPVVSFEAINGGSPSELGENPRLIVINAIGKYHEKLPFFAFVTQNIPRLIKIDHENITEDADSDSGPAEKMKVSTQGEIASIPDVEYLESMIFDQL